jgi:hypothetical protein
VPSCQLLGPSVFEQQTKPTLDIYPDQHRLFSKMSSIIKREESPETFLRAIFRTSTLPPAAFSDTAAMYKEEEVEPPVLLPNIVFAHQYYASRESSISTNSAYQGSSPRKYRLDGRVSRYVSLHSHRCVALDVFTLPLLFGGWPWQPHVAENFMLFRILHPHLDSSKPSEPREPQTTR